MRSRQDSLPDMLFIDRLTWLTLAAIPHTSYDEKTSLESAFGQKIHSPYEFALR